MKGDEGEERWRREGKGGRKRERGSEVEGEREMRKERRGRIEKGEGKRSRGKEVRW